MILQHNCFLHAIEVIDSTGKVYRGCVAGSLHVVILLMVIVIHKLIVQRMIRQLNCRFGVERPEQVQVYRRCIITGSHLVQIILNLHLIHELYQRFGILHQTGAEYNHLSVSVNYFHSTGFIMNRAGLIIFAVFLLDSYLFFFSCYQCLTLG